MHNTKNMRQGRSENKTTKVFETFVLLVLLIPSLEFFVLSSLYIGFYLICGSVHEGVNMSLCTSNSTECARNLAQRIFLLGYSGPNTKQKIFRCKHPHEKVSLQKQTID